MYRYAFHSWSCGTSKDFTYNDYGELNTQQSNHNNQNLYRYEILNRTLSGKIESKLEQTSTNTETFYQYTYDIAGRLTKVKTNGQTTEEYKYDHNGNRLEATVNNTTTKAYYTIEDQLEVYGQNTYRYNDDGYLQEKTTPQGTSTYSYGTLGELQQVITPTQTISYTHNANNQRASKEVNGTTVEKYLWADLTTLLAVYDSNDTLKQRFTYTNSRMPTSMEQDNETYYLHYDQVGTLKAISNTNGNIIKEITYDTYGNILTDSNEAFTIPFGFAGGLYDTDTKLTRFGYRDYDAYTGKWTAKDPIGFSGGDSNLYGYVLGDPVDLFDPTGEIAPYIVYGIFIGGRLVYVGITKYAQQRAKAHAKRWAKGKFKELKNDICKTEARKYEQAGIEKGGKQLDNLINSISKKNPKYKDFLKNKKKYDSLWDNLF